ncbi:MAG: LytTR family transcriptional regulator [Clostridiales Family XIII bacterium]|nr:LytTR family transcriptional regulator [Clostridiales Family XIII bacterium]
MKNEVIITNRFLTARVDADSILYLKKQSRKIFVHTENKSYWEYCAMEDMLERAGTKMYPCHHFLAVNLDKVQDVSYVEVTLINGMKLHMSRSALLRAKKAWKRHIGRI